jgi:predicted permease
MLLFKRLNITSQSPALWWIHLIGVIVPRRLRADWRQEWEAELQYRERLLAEWDNLNWKTKMDLWWRSLGAFRDALLLQPHRLEDDMFRDLQYGWRMLIKHKGFTAVAVLSLALGIGANTALFSLVDTVLLKTLPVGEPEQLVLFNWQSGRNFRTNGMRGTFSPPAAPGLRGASIFRYDTFEKLRQTQAANPDSPLESLFAFAPLYELTAVVDEQAEVVTGQAVSGGYYAGLKVQPIYGRTIDENDNQASATPVVVLSHHYWQERYGANPEVIGQQLKLNKNSFTIIGVTPADFAGSLQVNQRPAVTLPIVFEPLVLGERTAMGKGGKPGFWWVLMMGRLKPNVSMEQARDSLDGTFQAQALDIMPPPRKDNETATIEPGEYPRLVAQSGSRGAMETRNRYSTTIYGLFGVVAVVLLIACANVANLLLARAALRVPEINVRLAVGAGRWRLIRQLLTESVLLSLVGGAVGVLFAYWGKDALAALADRDTTFLPPGIEPSLNWRVLLFTVAISMLTGVLFGLAPAWRATQHDLTTGLKGRRMAGAVSRLSKGLVIAQVALSLLLLIGAGLFIRTLNNLQKIDLGFNQENLLLFSIQPEQGGYKDERLLQFYQQLFTRLDSLPGVRSATFGRIPLIAHYTWNTDILLPGETKQSGGDHLANRQMVRENYFTTMEIPVLRGRNFTAQDSPKAPKVGIVNQDFGNKYFPNEEVVGKRITDTDGDHEIEIIGVVADTKYNSQRDAIEPLLYTSWQQEGEQIGEMYFALRTEGEPTALVNTVRQTVREMDTNLPITEFTTQETRAQQSLAQERLYARLLSFFGGLALLLAAIGLSGVLAYSVAQRKNEIGIRMALGAQISDVLRLVIWQGMKLVLVGLAVGALGAYGVKRLFATQYFSEDAWQREVVKQLYGITGNDPVTFFIIAGLLTMVALVACWLPAHRAAQVDPLEALRHE